MVQGNPGQARARRSRVVLVFVGLLLPCLPSFAQNTSGTSIEESERQRSRELNEFRRLDRNAEAELFRPLESSRRVRFEEVLEHPDDPELNFRWAQTQVADGNLTGASATLQRLLLNQPDLHRVRLFYAIVLFRLGSMAEADAQFLLLEEEQADATGPIVRGQAKLYRERISQQSRRTRHALLISGGSTYDSNKNSGPLSDQISFFDTRVALGSANRSESDSGWFSLAQWSTEHDLGRQEDQQVVARTTYFHSQQDDFRLFDVQALNFDVGLRTRGAGTLIHPKLVVDVVDLSREKYLRSVAAEIEAHRPLGQRLLAEARLRVTHEDFDGTPDTATAAERSGYRTTLNTDLGYTLSPYQRLSFNLGLTHKSANKTYHAYSGWELGLSHQWITRSGAFLLTGASLGFDRYRKNQDSISVSKRRDLRSRVRASIGLPLGAVLGSRFTNLRDLVLSVSGEAQISRSNLPNYEFRNRKLTVSFSKRFGF